jgi:hypothetical protein
MVQNFNPFEEFLEQNPQAQFQSFLPQNLTRKQQQFGTGLYGRFADLFKGAIGRDIRSGGTGALKFGDFLENNFNFNKEQAFGDPIATGRARFQAPARFLLRR